MPGVFFIWACQSFDKRLFQIFKNLWGVGVVALSITKVLGAGGE
jgi:hypothetical protein